MARTCELLLALEAGRWAPCQRHGPWKSGGVGVGWGGGVGGGWGMGGCFFRELCHRFCALKAIRVIWEFVRGIARDLKPVREGGEC